MKLQLNCFIRGGDKLNILLRMLRLRFFRKNYITFSKELAFVTLILFCTSSFAATRYWVGGTGSWDGTTTNWSASSGGASGASAPTSADNVIFDASSGLAGATVTVNATANCLDFTWSVAAGTWAINDDLNIYGSMTLNAGMTVTSSSGYLYFKSTSGGRTITTNGKTIPCTVYFNGAGGDWTLQDAFTTSAVLYLDVQAGTLNTNNQNLTFSGLADLKVSGGILNLGSSTVNFSSGSAYSITVSSGTLNCNSATITNNGSSSGLEVSGGTLNLGSSTVTTRTLYVSSGTIDFSTSTLNLTGGNSNISYYELSLAAGATVTTGTPTITFTGANNTYNSPIELYLGTKTIYDVVLSTGSYLVSIFDGGGMHNLTVPTKSWLNFESAKTFTFSGIVSTTSTCTSYSLFSSSIAASAATISLSGTQTDMTFMQLKDITNSGTGINCTSCVDAGTNSGFTFVSPKAAQTLYWRGTGTGTGNWGTGTNWTENADGTAGANTCVPTIADNVVFDANSFDAGSKTVTVDQRITVLNINFTGTTNSPTFTNSTGYEVVIAGNLTLTSGIGTFTNAGNVYFQGSGSQLVTCGGKTVSSATTYFTSAGTVYLEDDGYFGTVYIKAGTLDVRNNAASTVYNMNVVGDWWHTGGTFTPRTDATKYVIFNHASSSQYLQSAETFYNLQVNKSTTSSQLYTYASQTITNELKITSGNFRVYVYTTTVSGLVTIASTGTLYGTTGTFTYNNDSPTAFGFSEGTIKLDGSTFNIGSSGSHTHTSLIVGDAASNSATLQVLSGTLNIIDQLRAKSDGIMDIQGGTVNIKTNTSDGGTAATVKWEMDASSQFKQSGGTINVLGAADNNTTNAVYFDASSTFTPGDITAGTVVLKSTTSTYDYPVDFGGKTLFSLTANQASRTFQQVSNGVILKGNLTLTAGTYDANGLAMSVAGNWVNNATYTENGSAVTFNGGAAQTISGSSTTTYHDITIANTSGDVALSVNANSTGTLTMTTGDLVIATTKSLTITDVDDPGISGGSASSMIVTNGTGTVKKTYTSTTRINFPMGDGTTYRPVGLTPSTAGSTMWTISYTPSLHADRDIEPATGLTNLSILEYFTITQSNAISATLDLTWHAGSGVQDYTELVLAHYDGTTDWDQVASTPVGADAAGTLTSNAPVSSFGPFTLGTTSYINPLPIQLLSFTGTKEFSSNRLDWITASEKNNDFFTVEKTTDGVDYEIVGIQNGAANSVHELRYSLDDNSVQKTINYYRLKQTDFDGKYSFSPIISIDNRTEADKAKVIVRTVNLLGQEVDASNYKGIVIVSYSDGSSEKRIFY